MKKVTHIASWLAVYSLCVSTIPGIEAPAYAQVGGDDDFAGIAFHKKVSGTPQSNATFVIVAAGEDDRTLGVGGKQLTFPSSEGVTYTWSLGFIPVGEMLVFSGRAREGYVAQTEYHYFAPQFRYWLDHVDPNYVPLRFEKRRLPIFPSSRSAGKRPFQGANPRTFRLATHPTRLAADPSEGRHLFHLASAQLGAPHRWIDHYLVMDFAGNSTFPALHWYVDTRSVQDMLPQMDKGWRTDERWAVRPLDGQLTPIEEAMGYEMVPRPSRLDQRGDLSGAERAGTLKGRLAGGDSRPD